MALFDGIADTSLMVRRIYFTAERVIPSTEVPDVASVEQIDLFTDYDAKEKQQAERQAALEQERRLQAAMLDIKKRFGNNAILKGTRSPGGSHSERPQRTDWRA